MLKKIIACILLLRLTAAAAGDEARTLPDCYRVETLVLDDPFLRCHYALGTLYVMQSGAFKLKMETPAGELNAGEVHARLLTPESERTRPVILNQSASAVSIFWKGNRAILFLPEPDAPIAIDSASVWKKPTRFNIHTPPHLVALLMAVKADHPVDLRIVEVENSSAVCTIQESSFWRDVYGKVLFETSATKTTDGAAIINIHIKSKSCGTLSIVRLVKCPK